jgi:hypothetical protein
MAAILGDLGGIAMKRAGRRGKAASSVDRPEAIPARRRPEFG